MTRIVSFWLLVAIIVAVALVFYQVMAGFLLPLFLATLLVVIFQPIHRRILGWCGARRPLLAATLATGAVLVCVFLPAGWIISAAASQSLALIRQIDLNSTLRQLQNVRVSLDLDMPQFEEAAELVPLFRDLETAARELAGDAAANPMANETVSQADSRTVSEAASVAGSQTGGKETDNQSGNQAVSQRTDSQTVETIADQGGAPTVARASVPAIEPLPPMVSSLAPAVAAELARRFEAVGEQLDSLFRGFPDDETDWPRPEIQPVQQRLEKVRYALRAGAQAARRSATATSRPEPIRDIETPRPASGNLGQPEAGKLNADHSNAGKLNADQTDGGKSDASQADGGKSDIAKPEAPNQEAANQEAANSESGQPESGRWVEGKPAKGERDTGEPTSGEDRAGGAESPAVVRAAEEAAVAFAELRQSLPRGLPRLWLRQAANPSPAQLRQWRDNAQGAVQSWLLPAANATAGFVIQLIFGGLIMIVSVFFFFADGDRMTVNVMRLIPLDIRHQQELLDDFAGITRAVVTATIVAAVAQGVLAGFGFWFSGVESVMFLVLLTIVLSMIPFVGAMSVWIPVCLWIGVVEGRIWTALALAIYSGVVVSQVDNIIKPMILQGRSNLHPLLALLSVLGGVKALGPIGILIGPMVVVFLQTLLKILHREMTSLEGSARRPATVPDVAPPTHPSS